MAHWLVLEFHQIKDERVIVIKSNVTNSYGIFMEAPEEKCQDRKLNTEC